MSAASSFKISAVKVSLQTTHVTAPALTEVTKGRPVLYNQRLDQGRIKEGKNRVSKFGSLQRAHDARSIHRVPD